jgi:hypothetical protein
MEGITAGRGGESGREAGLGSERGKVWEDHGVGWKVVLYSIEKQGFGNGIEHSDHHGSDDGRIAPSVYIILIDSLYHGRSLTSVAL